MQEKKNSEKQWQKARKEFLKAREGKKAGIGKTYKKQGGLGK